MSNWTLSVPRPDRMPIQVELGHEMIRSIALAIDDVLANIHLQSALAFHPSAAIRAAMARRDFIDAAAVQYLLADSDREVRQGLIWSAAARQQIDHDWLIDACDGDARLAIDVAGEIDAFDLIDPVALLGYLADHADPGVRAAVAGTQDAGRATVRMLARDADPEVRVIAQDTLEHW